MSPPITDMVEGRQYVWLPGGQGNTSGANAGGGRGSACGDAGSDVAGPAAQVAGNPTPQLLTFVLDGAGTIPDARAGRVPACPVIWETGHG
jgi:hypothetical protein